VIFGFYLLFLPFDLDWLYVPFIHHFMEAHSPPDTFPSTEPLICLQFSGAFGQEMAGGLSCVLLFFLLVVVVGLWVGGDTAKTPLSHSDRFDLPYFCAF